MVGLRLFWFHDVRQVDFEQAAVYPITLPEYMAAGNLPGVSNHGVRASFSNAAKTHVFLVCRWWDQRTSTPSATPVAKVSLGASFGATVERMDFSGVGFLNEAFTHGNYAYLIPQTGGIMIRTSRSGQSSYTPMDLLSSHGLQYLKGPFTDGVYGYMGASATADPARLVIFNLDPLQYVDQLSIFEGSPMGGFSYQQYIYTCIWGASGANGALMRFQQANPTSTLEKVADLPWEPVAGCAVWEDIAVVYATYAFVTVDLVSGQLQDYGYDWGGGVVQGGHVIVGKYVFLIQDRAVVRFSPSTQSIAKLSMSSHVQSSEPLVGGFTDDVYLYVYNYAATAKVFRITL